MYATVITLSCRAFLAIDQPWPAGACACCAGAESPLGEPEQNESDDERLTSHTIASARRLLRAAKRTPSPKRPPIFSNVLPSLSLWAGFLTARPDGGSPCGIEQI